ncbi:MAG: alpha/beta hydrolase, partial [Rhodospirillaceae bacterium]
MLDEAQNLVVEEIEYIRHGDRSMILRLIRPAGDGPFPFIVDLHGGAWNNGSIDGCRLRDEILARAGMAAAALDFRHATDGYPTSLQDINFAIRWLKANADAYALDADRAALCGQSSGGHLAMLAAMRPEDPRYAALPLDAEVDARVRCVGMTWPVINPLSRYRHALRCAGDKWAEQIPGHHETYWRDEAAMEEGNPMLALERGEAVETPPAVWLQGTPDIVHDYHDPESGQVLTGSFLDYCM